MLNDILGDKAAAEVYLFAAGGLEDLPSTTMLRKSLELLVEKFSKKFSIHINFERLLYLVINYMKF